MQSPLESLVGKRPEGVRLIKLKVNTRMEEYIKIIARAKLTEKDRASRRGYRSPAIVKAIEDWGRALEEGEFISFEKLRVYLLEYLDSVYITPGIERELYLPPGANKTLEAIFDHLQSRQDVPNIHSITSSRTRGVTYRLLAGLAVCRLVDNLGRQKPLL